MQTCGRSSYNRGVGAVRRGLARRCVVHLGKAHRFTNRPRTPTRGPLAFRGWRAFSWAFIPTYSKRGLKTAYNKPSTCGFAKSWGTFCGIKISIFIRRQRRTFGVMGDACARSMYLPL